MKHYDDTFEHKGRTYGINGEYDDTMRAPWEEEDCHGPVSDWTTRDKRPGERVLCTDRRARRYYDFSEAVKMARREGWGTAGTETLSPGARAAAAVEADFKRLRAWCEGQWQYLFITVTDLKTGESMSLGGVESDSYLETARDLADEIHASRRTHWLAQVREARERRYWATRDVMTMGA